MSNAELTLDWIIRHRGEEECEKYLTELAVIADRETIEETLCHIWAGFYDAEPVQNIAGKDMRKSMISEKRQRKIAERRNHYRKVCERKVA